MASLTHATALEAVLHGPGGPTWLSAKACHHQHVQVQAGFWQGSASSCAKSPDQRSKTPAHSRQVTTERRLLQKAGAENMRAGRVLHKSGTSVPRQAGGASSGAGPRSSQAQRVLGCWALPVHKAWSHPEKLKSSVNMSMLPQKKPLLRSCNNCWVSLWCPENRLMAELLPSALLS